MMTFEATSAVADSSVDLDAVWDYLNRAGVLDDCRKDAKPYRAFVRAYNDLQSAIHRPL